MFLPDVEYTQHYYIKRNPNRAGQCYWGNTTGTTGSVVHQLPPTLKYEELTNSLLRHWVHVPASCCIVHLGLLPCPSRSAGSLHIRQTRCIYFASQRMSRSFRCHFRARVDLGELAQSLIHCRGWDGRCITLRASVAFLCWFTAVWSGEVH